MAEKKRVLITGAAGSVGSALWKGWEEQDRYELTLTDHREISYHLWDFGQLQRSPGGVSRYQWRRGNSRISAAGQSDQGTHAQILKLTRLYQPYSNSTVYLTQSAAKSSGFSISSYPLWR